MNFKSVKTQLIIFLFLFILFLSLKEKYFHYLASFFIAISFSVAIESIIIFLKKKQFKITESSIITGSIIGIVAYYSLFHLLVTSLIAICSKHFIKLKGKHIFNPAGFGLLLSSFITGETIEWKGAYLWYILAPAGIYFTSRIKKLELLYGYIFFSFLLFGLQSVFSGGKILEVAGYLNYFFIFIMLIEPKTSPFTFYGKIIFGSVVAILIFLLTQSGAGFDVEIASLLFANLFISSLHKLTERR